MKKTYQLISMLLLGAGATAWGATVSYTVHVDTSSLAGTYGYLDFQFNPGPPVFVPAELDVRNFDGGGGALDPGVFLITGDVLDINNNFYDPFDPFSVPPYLPDGLNMYNCCAAANDYITGFTFGNYIDFGVTLTWTPDVANSPSAFYFSMLDWTGTPVLTNAPPPFTQALELDFNPNQSVTGVTYSPQVQTNAPPSAVPEPTPVYFMISGLFGLCWLACRRRPPAGWHKS